MITISRNQINAVRTDGLLGPVAASLLSGPALTRKPSASLTDSEWDDLHDACLDALMNASPVIESFDAEQSRGAYTVSIHGVPGAYYVTAPEFDHAGVFSTLQEARNYADSEHGEFRVREGSDEADPDEEEWVEPDPCEPSFPDELLVVLAGTDSPETVSALKTLIVSDEALVLLANGANAPEGMEREGAASELVLSFEKSLPKPQGTIDGMARGMKALPRLHCRVELFMRLNERLPDASETAALYEIR